MKNKFPILFFVNARGDRPDVKEIGISTLNELTQWKKHHKAKLEKLKKEFIIYCKDCECGGMMPPLIIKEKIKDLEGILGDLR